MTRRASGFTRLSSHIGMVNSDQGLSMTKDLKSGDKVSWNSSQGEIDGMVEKKVTSTTTIKNHTAKATEDNPEYLVRSDKTGAEAIHKPDQLRKR
jgi:hypothetical protein